jgi:signal transduction histidine kinase
VSIDLEPKRASGLWSNRLWILSAALGAASIASTMVVVHDTSRQRAAVHSVVRSTAEQVVALAGSRLEMLALETFAPVTPWSALPSRPDSALGALLRVQRNVARCRCRDTLAATEFFRYDVSTRVLTRLPAGGAKPSSETPSSSALERTAENEARRVRAHPELAIHLVVGRELADHAALTVVQYDSVGTPFMIYGVLMRARDLALPLFRDAAARAALIDSAGRMASLRTIQFRVTGPDSTTILETTDDAHYFRATIHSGGPLEGLAVTAALASDQIPARVNVGRPELLHLGVLLLATILVIGFAVGSSRRELALARARSDFIAGVSHDLRMPLAQILIAGETLTLERERDAADRRDLSHAIVREARRLVGIVDNVLLFSRSGTARPKPALRSVPVDDLFDSVVEAVGLAVDDAGQTIAVVAPPSLAVTGDRHLLRQALVNLVDNALKYGTRGQQIELGAERSSPAAVRLYVDDHGPGIPPDERARLFEPYERLSRDRTSERTGSGLGLAVVREIATALGGRAWLDDAPGGGIRAVIELRNAEPITAAPSPAMT